MKVLFPMDNKLVGISVSNHRRLHVSKPKLQTLIMCCGISHGFTLFMNATCVYIQSEIPLGKVSRKIPWNASFHSHGTEIMGPFFVLVIAKFDITMHKKEHTEHEVYHNSFFPRTIWE